MGIIRSLTLFFEANNYPPCGILIVPPTPSMLARVIVEFDGVLTNRQNETLPRAIADMPIEYKWARPVDFNTAARLLDVDLTRDGYHSYYIEQRISILVVHFDYYLTREQIDNFPNQYKGYRVLCLEHEKIPEHPERQYHFI